MLMMVLILPLLTFSTMQSHRFNPIAFPTARASIKGAHHRLNLSKDGSDDEDNGSQSAFVHGDSTDLYAPCSLLFGFATNAPTSHHESAASNPSNGGATNLRIVTHALRRPSPCRTRSPAMCPYSTGVRFYQYFVLLLTDSLSIATLEYARRMSFTVYRTLSGC